jgi:hypothetical protein
VVVVVASVVVVAGAAVVVVVDVVVDVVAATADVVDAGADVTVVGDDAVGPSPPPVDATSVAVMAADATPTPRLASTRASRR